MSAQLDAILTELESQRDPAAAEAMARFAITGHDVYGVKIPVLRQMAKELKKDTDDVHALAQALWDVDSRETRVLASMVDDRKQVTESQMEAWVSDFDSWEVCDQTCQNLFGRTPMAHEKALAWSGREEEFVKRAGFVLMARQAVTNKKAPDVQFLGYLPVIERESDDDRNFVKKAVNWALRQIGKRNLALNAAAMETAERLVERPEPSARWIGRDALKELTSAAQQARLEAKAQS